MAEGNTNPLGTHPLPGDSPAGANVRYEPEFEELEAEVAKMGNPAAGEIKWKRVVELSETILKEKCKDLLVGAYYAYGMLQQQGYQGLEQGLATINGMVQSYWDDLFPEARRMRARETALDWLIDKVTAHLESSPPASAEEVPVLEEAARTVDVFTEFINPKLESPNPKLAAFSRALGAKASEASGGGEQEGDMEGETTPAAQSPAAGAGASSGLITNRKVAFERLKEVADYLKRTEPHSPVAYLVQRAIKWGDMSLENVIAELVKNNDVRRQVYETLGLRQEEN